jgi:ABC-type amino acid transport substrate-binding protein
MVKLRFLVMARYFLIIVIIATVVSSYLGARWANISDGTSPVRERAYERVMRTRVLRCAYYVWPPYADKDLTTGKLNGLYIDYTEALARYLGLRVDWTIEAVTGQQVDVLRTNKADAICLDGPWNAAATMVLRYAEPVYIDPVAIYARADDHRFDNSASLDQPMARFAAIDGDVSQYLVQALFPSAQQVTLPLGSDNTRLILDVLTRKADLVILDKWLVDVDTRQNGQRLRQVAADQKSTTAFYPVSFGVLPEDEMLAAMLSQAVRDMRNEGIEEIALKAYEPLFSRKNLYRVPSAVTANVSGS